MGVSKVVDQTKKENVITLDRRRAQRRNNDPTAEQTGEIRTPRRKKERRRHIDPTTCERDYNDDEIEFMRAMDDYKHNSGRMFPTCSEVLEVIRGLGYAKLAAPQVANLQVAQFDDSNDFDIEIDDSDDFSGE